MPAELIEGTLMSVSVVSKLMKKRPVSTQNRPSGIVQDKTQPTPNQAVSVFQTLVQDPRFYCWLALLISLGCLYQRLALFGDAPNWITSDSLWPVNLIIDLFRDGYHLRGWRFSVAPCWFPDVVLTGVTYALTGNAVVATVLSGFIQFVLLVAGVCLTWRVLDLRLRCAAEVLTLLTACSITIYVALHIESGYGAWHQFYLPQTHVGNLANLVWAINLALLLLKGNTLSRGSLPIALVAVCLLGTMSNVLFAVHFLVPLTVAVAVVWAIGSLPVNGKWTVLLSWGASLAGYVANKAFFSGTDVSAQASIRWSEFRAALHVFATAAGLRLSRGDLLHLLALSWLLACTVMIAILLYRKKAKGNIRNTVRLVFFMLAAGASACSAGAIIAGGSGTLTVYNDYGVTTRYLHPMFFLPLFTWPLVTELARGSESVTRRLLMSGASTALIVALVVLLRTETPEFPLHNYAPPLVRDLDKYAQAYGIKYGVAGYWHARLITLLSRTGLRVYQVDHSLRPYHWVNNLEWYSQSIENPKQAPVFSFAVLRDRLIALRETDVSATLGDRHLSVTAGKLPVLIYPERTQNVRAQTCRVTPATMDFTPSGTIEFSGSCLGGSTGQTGNGSWFARAPGDTAGIALLSMSALTPGEYTLEANYSAGGVSAPGESTLDIGDLDERVFYSGPLSANNEHVVARFSVPNMETQSDIKARVIFTGLGELRIQKLILRKAEGKQQ